MERIDNVKDHTYKNDSHTKADGNNKYGIQFSDKRYGGHGIHGTQPFRLYYIFKAKEASEHKSEKCGKDSGAADDSCKIDVLDLVKKEAADQKNQSLSYITEHSSENEGVGNGNEPGWIHFSVSRKSIHFGIHLKWLEQLRVL